MSHPSGDSPLSHLAPLPRDRSVGIGCIGAGFIMADCHLVAYRAAGLEPVAITSQRPQAAAAVAARHGIGRVWPDWRALAADGRVEVVDVAVPPDVQPGVVDGICGMVERGESRVRGILAQKPLACDYAGARELVRRCREAGVRLVVNQNMRYDHAVRACGDLLARRLLGEPVLATIDMRAIPHWMPWQERQGWVTLRIMSIHHFDTFRGWFGTPRRVFTSVRTDPRTLSKFAHVDGICLSILEYDSGLRAFTLEDTWAGPAREGAESDCFVKFRVEGTQGLARGEVGWPKWPERTPSTLDWTTVHQPDGSGWQRPRWNEAWFPDAFIGPMAELLRDLEGSEPATATGDDNLLTMALVDAAYVSAREHRAVEIAEIVDAGGTSR